MVSTVTIRKIVLAGSAAALAGCSSMPAPASSLQSAVYRVEDGKPAMAQATADKMPGESKPVHIYWFLGGR